MGNFLSGAQALLIFYSGAWRAASLVNSSLWPPNGDRDPRLMEGAHEHAL